MKFKKGDIVRYKDYYKRSKINNSEPNSNLWNCTRFKIAVNSTNEYNSGYLLDDNYEMINDDDLQFKSRTLLEDDLELDVDYYRRLKLEKIKSKFYE